MIPIFYYFFENMEAEEILPDSFYEINITIVPKSDKDITRKETTD